MKSKILAIFLVLIMLAPAFVGVVSAEDDNTLGTSYTSTTDAEDTENTTNDVDSVIDDDDSDDDRKWNIFDRDDDSTDSDSYSETDDVSDDGAYYQEQYTYRNEFWYKKIQEKNNPKFALEFSNLNELDSFDEEVVNEKISTEYFDNETEYGKFVEMTMEEKKNFLEEKQRLQKEEGYYVKNNPTIIIDIESLDSEIEESENGKIVYKQMLLVTSDINAYENIEVVKVLDGAYVIKFPATYTNVIVTNEHTYKLVDEHAYWENRNQERNQIREDYEELNLNQNNMEVTPSELENAKQQAIVTLIEQGIDVENPELNPYSVYFLSTDALPVTMTPEGAYAEATDILYMYDQDLWGVPERWISPNDVYNVTPTLETNPSGLPISDCEEHAMTYVALCRAQGVAPEDVRVVIGYVEIGDEKIGHAWAQIRNENGLWVNIEATSGSYYENGELHESLPLPYNYYESKTYPVIEYWGMFNDKYYVDSDGSNAPDDWVITETSYNVGSSMSPSVSGFYTDFMYWIEQTIYQMTH